MRLSLWVITAAVILAVVISKPAKDKKQARRRGFGKGNRQDKIKRKGRGEKVLAPKGVGVEADLPTEDRSYLGGQRKRRQKINGTKKERNAKIKSGMCREKNVGKKKRKFKFMTCGEADQLEQDIYQIKSKIAKLKGKEAPNPDDTSMLFGDLLLTPEQAAAVKTYYEDEEKKKTGKQKKKKQRRGREKREIIASTSELWNTVNSPNGTIYYTIDSSLTDTPRAQIPDSMNYYSSHSCLNFVESQDPPTNAFLYIEDDQSDSCYTYLGRSGQPQKVNYPEWCSDAGSIEHEVAHTLGMYHEQSRSDRDDNIIVDTSVLFDYQFRLCNSSITGKDACAVPDFEYDFGSIMQYYAGTSGNGKVTMTAVDPRYQYTMGWDKSHMSFLDLKQLNTVYCSVAPSNHAQVYANPCTSGPSCQNGGYRNPASCSTCICPDVWGGPTCTERFAGSPSACGADLTATSEWQILNQYMSIPQGAKCVWKIEAPEGNQIEYRIASISLTTTTSWLCNRQYLEIRDDGRFLKTGPRYCTYSNVPDPQQWVSSGNKVFLIAYDIPDSYPFGRFIVEYRCVGDTCAAPPSQPSTSASTPTTTEHVTTTTTTSTSYSGNVTLEYCCWYYYDTYCRVQDYYEFTQFPATFISPNYPNIYPYYYKCIWLLTAIQPNRVQITFDHLNTEDWSDPVNIYDGYYTSAIKQCLYNHNCNGMTYTSYGQQMTVELYQRDSFTSNDQNENGFQISFQPA